MAFKNFQAFTNACKNLQQQLDRNTLLVRIINRVSQIITSSQAIPSQYTTKYNSVQLLQYDSEGNLNDVTPAEQLSVPENVLGSAVSSIQSNQRLIEGDIASLHSIKLDTECKLSAGIGVPVLENKNQAWGFLVPSAAYISGSSIDVVNRAQVASAFFPIRFDESHVFIYRTASTPKYKLKSLSYIDGAHSVLYLQDGTDGGVVLVKRFEDVLGNIPADGMIIGTIVKSNIPGFTTDLTLRAKPVDSSRPAFESGSTSLFTFSTNNADILFSGRSDTQPKPAVQGCITATTATDWSFLYPKDNIDALVNTLTN